MKKNSIYLSIVFLMQLIQISNYCNAQESKEFLNSPDAKVIWLGIDFSQVRLLGDVGATTNELKDRYFSAINDVVINEADKYNIAKAFHKLNVSNDIGMVSKNNSKLDTDKMKVFTTAEIYHMTPAMVENLVKQYDFGDKKGWGIVFIMEALNKTGLEASMYVTIVNLEKRNVVMTKRMIGKPRGFGARNFWAGAIYDVLKDIEKTHYDKWKSE